MCHVTDERDVERSLTETVERFGRLDCLVANAGTSARSPFTDMPLSEWRSVMSTNLEGAFLCLRAAARYLIGQGSGGAPVGVSSTSAVHGAPGQEHYASSKTAMLAMMRSLAVELARYGIRCNSLLPGWTETELTAPADFETVGAFLRDPTITFHTGDSMVVDGGYTIF